MTEPELEIHGRYRPIPGHYDEVIGPSGLPRPHWRKLTAALSRMGADKLGKRWLQGRQLIQANGISYNVYGDPQGSERPWPLDPVPLALSAEEWQGIESAVAQRATLLNLMLGDLYGPQRLIRDKWLPPDFVFRNPSFLRPCHGIVPPHGVHLCNYAADLARSPDGRWWVLSDRTQAPSGAGYALENRLVSAQILPEAFQYSRVRLLTRYFQSMRDGLRSLARTNKDNPRIVLLTPGPYNETYFEHAYLARYLGYTLVEGLDLSVRDGRVWLKTLGGLTPVDIILRRQDDTYCDPLELMDDSVLGVAGLVHAVRSGHAVVANALGNGLLETSTHTPFLPGICRQLLGEELSMPSVATWWCGDEGPCRYVLDHLNELVIKPAFPRFGLKPVFGASLSRTEREELAAKIERDPAQYVAQEQVALATAPVWTEEGIVPRYVVLRVFASWCDGSYIVMPGGLTRISTSADSLVVTMQRGGGSKDTWVMSDHDEGPSSLMQAAPHSIDVTRTADLPSRVADNLFWLGRYIERVEGQVRIVRALVPALSGECDFGGAISVEAAVAILARYRYLPASTMNAHPAEQRHWLERTLSSVIFDQQRPGGLGWTVGQVRRIAWQLKERLSSDTWRVLHQLDADFQHSSRPGVGRLLSEIDLLNRCIMTLSAFAGLVGDSMTRGHNWRFLDIGRRLERALQTTDLLKYGIASCQTDDMLSLETLLQVADSSITYRSRYYAAMQADLVIDLLLADEANPRSVGFQLATLSSHLDALPCPEPSTRYPLEKRLVLKTLTTVRLADVAELARRDGENGERASFGSLLDNLNADISAVADALNVRYLTHAAPSRVKS